VVVLCTYVLYPMYQVVFMCPSILSAFYLPSPCCFLMGSHFGHAHSSSTPVVLFCIGLCHAINSFKKKKKKSLATSTSEDVEGSAPTDPLWKCTNYEAL